jgi:DNA helicase-2/ATP-dependent DNA helicase PcrA
MQPSKYQQAIFDFISIGAGNAVVDAKAGSGKTTTIVEAAQLIPAEKRSVFLAFNKSIAEELKTRLPKHIEARTLNSLGHAAWMKHAPGKVVLDADKVKKLVRALQIQLEQQYQATMAEAFLEKSILAKDHFKALMDLVRKAKVSGLAPATVARVSGLVPDTDESWTAMAEHYGIEMPVNVRGIIELARLVLRRSVEDVQVIDFDDQFYMSLIYNASFPKFDWVFVDEAQDVSDIQREILKRILKPTGRLIAVGDPFQSIYGFRGSNPESLNLIKAEFKAVTLPLSICYRCDKAIITLAQETVPAIEASPSAGEGEVKDLGIIDGKFNFTVFSQADLVVCRYTAPLITLAYKLIAKKIACKVKGRDIAQGLITLIDKLKCQSVDRLVVKLNEWLATETRRLTAKDPDANLDAIQDKYDSLSAVIANSPFKTVDALKGEIEGMFADAANGVLTLSTVHKAKGLEADRVFILNFDAMPSKRATKEWEIKQENNLIYVAVTRAKHSLFFISEEKRSK